MAALGKAGLKALEALRSRLAPARVPGIQFTREVPTPRPPASPFVEKFEPAPIRVRDFDSPREVTIPMVTDQIDPLTGRQVINDVKHTIKPVPREAFDEFDELFKTNRQATILELFAEIENVENIDRLYLVTELMRRYRPQMAPRQARVLEQSLEEAAQRIGIPSQVGKMRMFTYAVPDETTVASMGRTFGGGKELLDEVNALGKVGAKAKSGDPITTVANLNKYDRGPDGGILGRAIMRGEAGDAADQRLIQNQINYWRRENLKRAELTEADFNGLRGLRYTDDMPESEAYNRTLAALQSATSQDEVAMILAQSRGRVVSPNYTDVLDDVAGRMTLDIAGGIPFDAELSSLGRHVPGSPYYIGRIEDATNVDDFFVQPPFIGPLMQSPLGARTVQGMLRNMGLPEIPESVLRGPRSVPEGSIRGVNVESRMTDVRNFEDVVGSATSGPIGYGPVFKGVEDPFGLARPVRTVRESSVGLIKRSFIEKGTDAQKRWAEQFAETRMTQLLSDDPVERANAAAAMRAAIARGDVEPSLAEEMRRIVRQPGRTGGGVRYTPGSTVPAQQTSSAPAVDFSKPPAAPSVSPSAGKIVQPNPQTNQGYRSYVPRTIENAQSSDITIAVARDFQTAGERLTYEAARGARRAEFGRNPRQPNADYDHWYSVTGSEGQFGTAKPIAQIPHMSQDMGRYVDDIVESLNQIAAQTGRPVTINGAGNGIARIGSQAEADTYARHIISSILEHPNRNFEIGLVRSGGQNGYDIAFNKAAKVYGIPSEINPSYHPSGMINIQLPSGKSTQISPAEYVKRYRLDTGDIGELSS